MASASLSRSDNLAKAMIGKRFGRLIVVESHGFDHKRNRLFLCQCDCGKTKVVRGTSIRYGSTESCGCLQIQRASARSREVCETHGASQTTEYYLWKNMHRRCRARRCKDSTSYFERGIVVCDRWSGPIGFANFILDMGPRPSHKYSIDRINNSGNYHPDNCRWATATTQANNRRSNRILIIDGVSLTLAEACRRYGCTPSGLISRLESGMDAQTAVKKPWRIMNRRKNVPSAFRDDILVQCSATVPGLFDEAIRRADRATS